MIDLKKWNLTLPIDKDGGTNGTAFIIKSLNEYENAKYFFKDDDDAEALVFVAPVDGATTSGSKYARSELREVKSDLSLAGWNLATGGTLAARLKVQNVPILKDGTHGKLIVGQIHGKNDELVRLYWENGRVHFHCDISGSDHKEHEFPLKNSNGDELKISLGQIFSYKIDAHSKKLKVSAFYRGEEFSSTINPVDPKWASDTLYFKAGCYLGQNETTATGFGRVSFSALDYSHDVAGGADDPSGTYTKEQVSDLLHKFVDEFKKTL